MVSLEEVKRNIISVLSTSLGIDQVIIRLLKAYWIYTKHAIYRLFSRCLALNYFP
jgi:hypothetical protein